MKKYLLILLALMLVVAVTLVPAWALTGGITAGEATGAVGQIVTIDVKASGLSQVESLAISYSVPQGLTLEDAQWLLSGSMMDVDLKNHRAVWAPSGGSKDLTEETAVFRLSFRIDALDSSAPELEKQIPVTMQAETNGDKTSYTASGKVSIIVGAQEIVLSKTELELDLNLGQSHTLTAEVLPAYCQEVVTWESGNPAIATVDANGVITPVGVGAVNITARAGEASAVCRVTVSCSHTEGTPATCTDRAICSVCNKTYGEINATAHTGTQVWDRTQQGHTQRYVCCNATGDAEAHSWENGICTVCSYDCQHTWENGVCTDCAIGCNHTWQNGVCGVCGLGCAHSGGEATCQARAVCEKCGLVYGQLNAQNHKGQAVWNQTATKHSSAYDCCGAILVNQADHTWENGKCNVCGYGCAHDVGVNVRGAVASTCSRPGYTGDSYCRRCNALVQTGTETAPSNIHLPSDVWTTSEECHWTMCALGCGRLMSLDYHVFQWITDREPTTQLEGLKHEQCITCGYAKEAVEIPVLPEEPENPDEPEIPDEPEQHKDVTHHAAVAATCVKAGTVEYWTCDCSNCEGKFFADETLATQLASIEAAVDPENHAGQTVLKNEAAATCQQAGYTGDRYCADCDALIAAGEATEKADHALVLTEEKENTCEEDGHMAYFHCAACDTYFAAENGQAGAELDKEALVIPAKGHTYEETWLSDAQGHWQACACGQLTEAAAHQGKLEGVVEATGDTPGYTGDLICQICGYEMEKGQVVDPDLDAPETGAAWMKYVVLFGMLTAAAAAVIFTRKKLYF